MEVVVPVDEIEQGRIKDSGKPGTKSAAVKQVTDPVVYKLVRVDFDGRLVPATDDELIEVENLLELEKNDTVSVSDVFETVREGLDKDDSKVSPCKGPLQIKNEKDEDSMKPHPAETLCTTDLNSNLIDTFHNNMSESGLEDEPTRNGWTGSGPNFSLLKGEINLDRLTIQELQETFRATFGRKTSVKDKLWLKRRIAMGLTNSCDVAVTNFVISDGKLLNKVDDICNNMACEDSISGESKDMVDGAVSKSSLSDSGCKNDNSVEHRGAKRVRKPTKRYIEEFSDKETNNLIGKSISPSLCFEQDKSSLSLAVKTGWSVNTGAFVTRRDSIGGSGVQVPYVSRVRRCRPRQSIMSLSKFESSDMALTKGSIESSDAPNEPQSSTSSKATLMDIKPIPSVDLIASEDLSEKRSMTNMSDSSNDREPKGLDSEEHTSRSNTTINNSGTNSDDNNVATVPTAKGGLRRKHHRPWTLTEVMKLVDGVSRFGPGRWSEIKRLSFSSYSYRTPVDLKDKWRNLLKASFSNSPAENGMNPRSKAPLPIPAPILVKVRELAEINGQAPDIQSKQGQWGSSVNKNK